MVNFGEIILKVHTTVYSQVLAHLRDIKLTRQWVELGNIPPVAKLVALEFINRK